METAPNHSNVGFVKSTFGTALGSLRSRYLPLLLGSAMLLAAWLPSQGLSWMTHDAQQRNMVRSREQMKEMNKVYTMIVDMMANARKGNTPAQPPSFQPKPMTPQETSQMAMDSLVASVAACGTIVFTLLLQFPAITCALMIGAAVAAGRPPAGQYALGFRRYGQTLVSWMLAFLAYLIVTLPVSCAGGISLLYFSIDSGELVEPYDWRVLQVAAVTILVLSPLYIWMLARWSWALMRVADRVRTPSGPWDCYRRSWRATPGFAQVRIAATILLVWLVCAILALPGAGIAYAGWTNEDETLKTIGYVVLGLTGALLVVPWVLASYGALYERIMTSTGDGPVPPVPVAADQLVALSQ